MTETTTQPDPQVIARVALPPGMDFGWDPQIGLMLRTGIASQEVQRNSDGSRTVTVLHRVARPARTPLTVADIPAGQGIASLYVDGESGAVMYRTTGGRSVPVPAMWVPTDDDGIEALNAALASLAATLPTVTTEETR